MRISRIDVMTIRIPILSEKERRDKHASDLYRYISDDYYILNDRIGVIYSDKRESVFVRVESDDGSFGYGEALAPTSPAIPASIISDIFAPILIGKNPYEILSIYSLLYDLHRVRGLSSGFTHDAIAAVDIALWDLKARSLGVPIYDLAGGKAKDAVPYYLSTIKGKDNAERLEYLDSYVRKGLCRFKLHTLGRRVSDDVQLLRDIRKKYSPDKLMLLYDGHWRMTSEEALRMGKLLEELDVSFFECPIAAEDFHGHLKLGDRMATGIAIGETMRTAMDFLPYLMNHTVGLIQPDIGRTGLSQMIESTILAKANNVGTAPHLSTHIGPALCSTMAISFISGIDMVEYQPDSFAAFSRIGHSAMSFEDDGFIRINKSFTGNGGEIDFNELESFASVKKVIRG